MNRKLLLFIMSDKILYFSTHCVVGNNVLLNLIIDNLLKQNTWM